MVDQLENAFCVCNHSPSNTSDRKANGIIVMTSTEIVDCTNLASGSVVDVETKSRHYRIRCLGGTAIRVSGHPEYCPEPVSARLHGSVDKQGSLEFGVIGRGLRLRFMLDD